MNKKLYLIPETKLSFSQLSIYMQQASSPTIDEEEAEQKQPGDPGYDDGDALTKERDMWGNEIGGGIW